MTDDKKSILTATLLAIVFVSPLVVWCGCGEPTRPPLTEVQGLQIIDLLRDVQKATVEKPHDPVPTPIDYSPRFDAIDKQLAKIAERSVVAPPKPPCPCHHK